MVEEREMKAVGLAVASGSSCNSPSRQKEGTRQRRHRRRTTWI
jgi:hypothetical protein